ncbi:MAG: PLP-dependent aminotransferase family protein [Sarcina sp.]|nr:PLP-dependent aminotransferase family protein [Sarcina sp.]
MNFRLDALSKEPAYLQLYREFVEDIVLNIYPYGAKLPSKRTIASDTGVSVITVEHAMSLLCDEGYIESRERSGYYVIYKSSEFLGQSPAVSQSEQKRPATKQPEMKQSEVKSPAVKQPEDFNSGTHRTADSLILYSVAAKTIRRVLQDYGEQILVKSPNHGCQELRVQICAYLARSRGILIKPSQVIIGSGAEYFYGLLVQLLGTDHLYAAENPCYEKILQVYNAMGAGVEQLDLSSDGILTEELERSKAKYLHVTPFHSYPSGITASISKKHEYLRWAENREGILIEDNYDSELTVSRKPEESLFSMTKASNVIYINTFSKTVAPSIRIGYMILPEKMEKSFNEKLGFYSCTVPVLDQLVIAELIRNGDFERHINRVRRMRRKQKREQI